MRRQMCIRDRVMDRGPRRYLAAISLRGKSNNLESRIERVSGMYFLEKLAGRLGKRHEHVSDVLRKERCPGSREREYLQAMHYRGCVSVTPRIPVSYTHLDVYKRQYLTLRQEERLI